MATLNVGSCVFFRQGQEDQAEETLLKLIRDPYNLGDVSWLAKSAAETAEWRRLVVRMLTGCAYVLVN